MALLYLDRMAADLQQLTTTPELQALEQEGQEKDEQKLNKAEGLKSLGPEKGIETRPGND